MSNPSEIIRVALIDNQPIVREGIRSILKPHPTIVIVGEFNSIAQALTELPSLQADLALVAYNSQRVKTQNFQWHVLGLSTLVFIPDPSKAIVLTLHSSDVNGLLPQQSAVSDYVEAIKTVFSGTRYLNPDVMSFLNETKLPPLWPSLTNRERHYFCLVTSGLPPDHIAASMNVSTFATRHYRRTVYKKLGISDMAGLTTLALKFGIAE